MFRGWNFLLGEIWGLILLAALLGLLAGWLIWGRRAPGGDGGAAQAQADRLGADLAACRARGQQDAARIAALEADLAAAQQAARALAEQQAQQAPGAGPARLSAPIGGVADDLKRIRGVGPKLEALLNRLGFWHFDQIARWTEAEVAWVDENLEAFKGRVTRDDWVAQARELAAGRG